MHHHSNHCVGQITPVFEIRSPYNIDFQARLRASEAKIAYFNPQ